MHRGLKTVDTVLASVSTLLSRIAMAIMAVMAVHIFASVASRWFLGGDIGGTLEIVTFYYMVVLTFLPLAMLGRTGLHIRADVITQFYSPRFQVVSEVAIQLLLTVFFAALTWRTLVNAIERTAANESMPSGASLIAIWPSRWLVPLGFAFAGACALAMAARIVTRDLLPGQTADPRPDQSASPL